MKNKWHHAYTTKDMTDFIVKQVAENIIPQGLISHINSVTDIVFSPDGSKFISGSLSKKDNTCNNLFVWDTKTGKRILKLKVNPEYISTISFSPDGKQILTSGNSDKNNLAVWDAQTGAMVFNLIDYASAIAVGFTPDGKKIISVDREFETTDMTVWNAQTGEKLFNIDINNPNLRYGPRAILSPDGTKIAAFFGSGEYCDITIIDTNTGTVLFTINNPTHNITALAFSPDSTKIVSGNQDPLGNITVWDAQTGEKLITIEGHHYSTRSEYSSLHIQSVQFSPNGKYITSTTYEHWNNFILWNAQTGEKLFDLIGHHKYINSVIFTPDNNYIISSSVEEEVGIAVWDIHTGKKLFNLIDHPMHVYSVALSPDGNTIVAGGYGEEDNLVVWRMPFDLITTIKNDLNHKQIELLYEHYRTSENGTNFIIENDSSDYAIYQSLPDLVKKAMHQKTNVSIFYQLQNWVTSKAFRLEIIINKIWEEQRLSCRQKILLLKRKISNLFWKRKNKLEFLKLVRSAPPFTGYSYKDASNIEMCILDCFIAHDCCYGTSSAKEWALDDQFHGGGGNLTSWEKENGYILITDMYSEEELPTVLKMSHAQFIKLLDDWEEKVYKPQPKTVIIKCENNQFIIETKD